MDTGLEDEQEVNGTMTPSVTETDAEESDPDEGNMSEEALTMTGAQNRVSDTTQPFKVVPIEEPLDSNDEEGEIGVPLVAPSVQPVDDESEHHGHVCGIQSTTATVDLPDGNPRSCKGEVTDGQADVVIGSLRVASLGSPRGTTSTENFLDVACTTAVVDELPRIPPADTHLLGVIPNQQIAGQPRAETFTFPPVTNEGPYVVCHPSKLIRDNSASTLQPALKHSNTQSMGPNLRLPSRVDEDSEVLIHDTHQLNVSATFDTTSKEVDAPDPNEGSTRNTPDLSERDNGQTSVRSAADAPPSPFRFSPPSSEDILETGSVVIAPPGTIVFQHSNGEHAYLPPSYQHHGYGYQMPMPVLQHSMSHQMIPTPPAGGGRRKITLRLQEDAHDSSRKSFFFRRSSRNLSSPLQSIEEGGIDRGTVTVSWFEGTASSELQEHVRKTVVRKMNLGSDSRLVDLRIIDESQSPHEEIVLSPYIPDGSSFLLRFSTRSNDPQSRSCDPRPLDYSAPDSPSAAPSPFPSSLDLTKLNAQLLTGKLNALRPPLVAQPRKSALKNKAEASSDGKDLDGEEEGDTIDDVQLKKVDEADAASKSSDHHEDDIMGYNPEDQIEMRLRQIAELMIADRRNRRSNRVQKEKRQVIFVIANYFVLFLSFIAICAELSARSPQWLASVEKHLESVQKCSTDQETLFECVSRGDFAGLMASLVLVLTRSAATKRFFLFGFETPKKLWAVVYESMVTAVCWGISYIMIRRGMNPDTRCGFLRKYWKDAVYGSLAGFNAAFMKHVLKNLIPQETFEHALQERQLKILSWLPSFR